jgi:predicted Co/Zn/Cd cation transporter (cation efflux family)
MVSVIFVIGLALAASGIIFLVGLATRSFVILFDYFGVSHYFFIGIGLFLMALDRIMRQKPGEGFWGMKHTKAK